MWVQIRYSLLSTGFGISTNWLLTGEGSMFIQDN